MPEQTPSSIELGPYPIKKLAVLDLSLPRQALLRLNKTGNNDLSDPLCNCMYNIRLRSSNCSRCCTAELTLDSFLQVFTNLKASFCKPINFSNICNNNFCDNTLNCNLKIFYQNVRGLKTKLVSLRCSFPMFHFYDIIILTETWLTPDISDSELGFAGFQVIRLDINHNNSKFWRNSNCYQEYPFLSTYFTNRI